MEINWTLLLLIAIVGLGLLGLAIALQTAGGRKRLADAALRVAEALIAYAIRWLEGRGADAGQGAQATPDHARIALAALRARHG